MPWINSGQLLVLNWKEGAVRVMDFTLGGIGTLTIIFLLLAFLWASVRIVPEYERVVVLRLGRLIGTKGPGIVFLIPFIDQGIRLSLRIVTLNVPTQEVITRDNVTTSVDAVVYYRVVDPARTVVSVEDYPYATAQLAQTTLRSVVGQAELDELLAERDKLNAKLQEILDESTEPWGIKVTAVEIKDVTIPQGLLSAIARQAEAERQRRALVIQARGEEQAADALVRAASKLNSEPGAMTLRVIRTLPELVNKEGSTVVFPVPMELGALLGATGLTALKKPRDTAEPEQEPDDLPGDTDDSTDLA